MQRNQVRWGSFVFRLIAVTLLALAIPVLTLHAQVGVDPDSRRGPADLFEAAERWQTGQGEAFTPDGLRDFIAGWHITSATTPVPTITPTPTVAVTATPTPTQGNGGTRTISLESGVEVEIRELFPGTGIYTGNAYIDILLSDTEGVGLIEVKIPSFLTDSPTSSNYVATLVSAGTTPLTAGFPALDILADGLNRSILAAGPPLGAGSGAVLSVTYSITVVTTPPLPDVPLDIPIISTRLLDGSNQPIAHDTVNGSLLINPTGNATPTPTPGGPTVTPVPTPSRTPTVTPTVQPTTATGLVLTACYTEELVGNFITVQVHLVDDQGRNVNPGVEGGSAPIDITLNVTGSGRINGLPVQNTLPHNNPRGLTADITSTMVETVTLSATAPGLNPSNPVQLTYRSGGRISGTVLVDGAPPSGVSVQVDILESNTGNYVASEFNIGPQGSYVSRTIPAGTYDVSFVSSSYSGPNFEGKCVRNITVVNGQTTMNVDADLNVPTSGVRVFGTLTASTGSPLQFGSVFLFPQGEDTCGNGAHDFISAFMPTPIPAIEYELTNVNPGTYTVFGSASGNDPVISSFSLPFGVETLEVGNSDIELDLVLSPNITVNMLSPLGYERASLPLTFEWSRPDILAGLPFTVRLFDTCGLVWSKDNITSDSVVYDGPALDKSQVYNWAIEETDSDEFEVNGTGLLELPYFVVE